MSDKAICVISIIGAIVCFILFILDLVESLRMRKNAYSKAAKADVRAGFAVAAGLLALCCVCVLAVLNFWAW